MALADYEKARKLGDKEVHARETSGQNPYLEVLDEVLEGKEIESHVNLGLTEIPIDLIAGTVTRGRMRSFSANFMPILAEKTEFATKWSTLYDHLVNEGQRDPVIAVEYMNHFYIQEGNKRVSVLKYMDAVCVEGIVTRYVPKRSEEKDVVIYFDFLRFYHRSGVNYLLMSEPGNYGLMCYYMGIDPDHIWTQEERSGFRAMFQNFRKIYKDMGGDRLPIHTGDAILTYLRFFDFDELWKADQASIRRNLQKIWVELTTVSNDESVSILMHPEESKSTNIFSSLFRPARSHIKAAFLYTRTIDGSGWNYAHELGRHAVEETFPDKVETLAVENVTYDDTEAVMEKLIGEGVNVIFTTSPIYVNPALKVSVAHPDVDILNCSLIASSRHIRSYYLRMYEAKFILGCIAGALTENHRIGYVADYPIYGTIASINAFALGARMIDRNAQIYLEWSTVKDRDPEETFRRNNVGIISNRDLNAPDSHSKAFGLYYLDDNQEPVNLAMPVWNWGKLYSALIASMLDGTWKKDASENSNQALNYWWGMSTDSIDVICSRRLPRGTHRLVDMLRHGIQSGDFLPISGKIIDQQGIVHNEDFRTMTPAEIIAMNWLDESIIGDIPSVDELKEEAKHIVYIQGISTMPVPDVSNYTWTDKSKTEAAE